MLRTSMPSQMMIPLANLRFIAISHTCDGGRDEQDQPARSPARQIYPQQLMELCGLAKTPVESWKVKEEREPPATTPTGGLAQPVERDSQTDSQTGSPPNRRLSLRKC